MGQVESSSKVCQQPPAPATESWRCGDYYNRLGIHVKSKSASFGYVPSAPKSASFNYAPSAPHEMKGTKNVCFTNGTEARLEASSQLEASGSGPSEPAFKATPSEEREDSHDMEMKYLDLKSQDDFRVSFLRKLSYEKVWVPKAQRPPKQQTVIIFDWDDTLLCTTFLNQRGDRPLHPIARQRLKDIAAAAKQLLEAALQLGHTFIITNAMHGWVEYSAAQYMPDLLPVLERIQIISARSRYEALYPEVSKWKVRAFLDVQRQMDSQIITNLNSLGDSMYEMDAIHVMGKEFAQALVKTVRFRDNPTPNELLQQLELVARNLERIVTNARNLRISLEQRSG